MSGVLFAVGSLFLSFGIASVLVGSSDWIARVLVAEDSEVSVPDLRARGRAIMDFGCRIVGIVLLAQVIPGVVRLFSEAALRESMLSDGASGLLELASASALRVRVESLSSLIGYGTTILLAVCLICLATRLSRLLYPDTPQS